MERPHLRRGQAGRDEPHQRRLLLRDQGPAVRPGDHRAPTTLSTSRVRELPRLDTRERTARLAVRPLEQRATGRCGWTCGCTPAPSRDGGRAARLSRALAARRSRTIVRYGRSRPASGGRGPADAAAQRLGALTDGLAVHMVLGDRDHTRERYVDMALAAPHSSSAFDLGELRRPPLAARSRGDRHERGGLELDAWKRPAARAFTARSSRPAPSPISPARLDATSPANEYEAELDVRMLAIDATSFSGHPRAQQRRPAADGGTIAQIVYERGKLQNPWTGSGGVLMGCVARVGRASRRPGSRRARRATGLTDRIPLTLDAVGPVDPGDHQVPVRGRAIVTGAMLCARMPSDLTETVALNALDVYPVASYIRDLAAPGGTCSCSAPATPGLLAVLASRAAVAVRTAPSPRSTSPQAALGRADGIDPASIAIAGRRHRSRAVAGELAERGAREPT